MQWPSNSPNLSPIETSMAYNAKRASPKSDFIAMSRALVMIEENTSSSAFDLDKSTVVILDLLQE